MTRSLSGFLERLKVWARTADQHRLAALLVMALAAMTVQLYPLSQQPQVALSQQVKRLNTDAKLYWGLAQNLANGTGFHDTVRNKDILPSIGHPKAMSLGWSVFGFSPAQYAQWALWLATLFSTWAVLRYTRSAALALASLGIQLIVSHNRPWLVGAAQPSIVLANAVLLAALAELYRSASWRPWGVLTGIALAFQLLVRPVLLYPVHFLAGVGALILIVPQLRQRLVRSPRASTWLALGVAVLVAEAVVGMVRIDSHVVYGDSRQVTGTYGAWTLYSANNVFARPDARYKDARGSKEWVEFAKLVSNRYGSPAVKMDWVQREKVLLAETLSYWKSYPGRALKGYLWRLQRLLGLHGSAWNKPIGRYHTAVTVLLFGLAIANLTHPATRFGLGVLSAALVLSYFAIHALFVWVGVRYSTPLFPLMSVGIVLALRDLVHGRRSTGAAGHDEVRLTEEAPISEASAT
jgi:hypothetical protein